MLDRPVVLRTVLFLDATRCVASGAFMIFAPPLLSSLTLVPGGILWGAGLGLFAIAAIIGRAPRRVPPLRGVWLVILDCAAWSIGSFIAFEGGLPRTRSASPG